MNFSEIAIFCLLLLLGVTGRTQNLVSSRALALGGNSVLLNDAFSILSNQANCAEIKQVQVATSYSIPYLVNEFQQQAIVGVIPIKKGGLSFTGQFTGKEIYRLQKLSLGYGLTLNEKLSLGIGLSHQQLRIQNYGVNSVITFDLGFTAKLNEKISLAATIQSIGGNHSTLNQERFPSLMQMGAKYNFSALLQTYFTIEKASNLKASYHLGIEYEAFKNGWFRTGAILNEKTLAFGFGYDLPMKLRLDVGSQWKQTLGWTPSIGLIYRMKEIK
jgi:hypothetical protein